MLKSQIDEYAENLLKNAGTSTYSCYDDGGYFIRCGESSMTSYFRYGEEVDPQDDLWGCIEQGILDDLEEFALRSETSYEMVFGHCGEDTFTVKSTYVGSEGSSTYECKKLAQAVKIMYDRALPDYLEDYEEFKPTIQNIRLRKSVFEELEEQYPDSSIGDMVYSKIQNYQTAKVGDVYIELIGDDWDFETKITDNAFCSEATHLLSFAGEREAKNGTGDTLEYEVKYAITISVESKFSDFDREKIEFDWDPDEEENIYYYGGVKFTAKKITAKRITENYVNHDILSAIQSVFNSLKKDLLTLVK